MYWTLRGPLAAYRRGKSAVPARLWGGQFSACPLPDRSKDAWTLMQKPFRGEAMQTRFSIRVVAVVAVVLAGGVQMAWGWGAGTRANLTARQQLRDKVCRATADGQITDSEYSSLLNQAQRTLDANEFQSFQKSLDGLVQQQPAVVESGPKAAITRRVQQTKAMFTKLIPRGSAEQHEHPQIADAESSKPTSTQEAEDPQKPGEAFVGSPNAYPDPVSEPAPAASKSMSATIKVVRTGHVATSR